MYSLPLRPRRLRNSLAARNLLKETRLHIHDFIMPLFINEALNEKKLISSMPGHFQLTLQDLPHEIDNLSALGIQAVLLFGIPEHKDPLGSASLSPTGIIQKAIEIIKKINPNMLVIADVCLCEYTSHGHCGVLKENSVDNDPTLKQLSQQAVSYAEAGADWVAPSSMTDGMVLAIRQALDNAERPDTVIMSYSAKYASSLYAPFREAAEGAPQFGDRKTYQMDFANANEALREAELDITENADIIMVKPAGFYLDIIFRIKQKYPQIPLCAYQVSGEYAMIKNAAQQGLINEEQAMLESLIAIKRSGADFIISYFAKDIASHLA